MTFLSSLVSLIIMAFVTIGVAAVAGHRMDKWKGMLVLSLILALAAAMGSVCILIARALLPDRPPGTMDLFAQAALLTMWLTAILGYFMNKWMGAVFLCVLLAVALLICFLGILFLDVWGLIIAMLLVTFAAHRVIRGLAKQQRAPKTVSLMWVGWCVTCLFGAGAAGTIGLLLITLPLLAWFWLGIYYLAQRLLPFGDRPLSEDRLRAFRAVLTYTLGRNYTYDVLKDRKLEEQSPGNRFWQFFAGPGIVVTSCDHTVVITDGIKIKRMPEPGLAFTELFEMVEPIDLRVQLRAFDVEAITKDGIRIKVLTFVPFRFHAGDAWPELGNPFPFRKSAVFKAMRERFIEPSRGTKDGKVVEDRPQRTWDDRVPIVATQVVRRIIGEYSFDDLCAPYQPNRDPRQEIVKEMQRQLRDELEPIGIQVIGGGLSNLLPADDKLLHQRMDNWRAEWERRIAAELGQGEAEYIRMVESARAQAQAEMIRTISEGFERAGAAETISTEVIALRFVEALEKMLKSPEVQQALPPSVPGDLEAMKRSMEIHRR